MIPKTQNILLITKYEHTNVSSGQAVDSYYKYNQLLHT